MEDECLTSATWSAAPGTCSHKQKHLQNNQMLGKEKALIPGIAQVEKCIAHHSQCVLVSTYFTVMWLEDFSLD